MTDDYKRGYADAMNWKVQNHLEHLPPAQREQEPVAWIAEGSENLYWDKVEALADSDGWITPLYKRRELVGLTDEEVKKEVEIEMEYYWDGDYIKTTGARDQLRGFARTIEAKLKEKNDRQDKR